MNRIAITCGDINGIGVEITLKALNILADKNIDYKIFFIVPRNVFKFNLRNLNVNLPKNFKTIYINDASYAKGKPTAKSGKTAYNAILIAHKLITENKADAMVTAPISKEAFSLANIPFKGHTNLLAKLDNSTNVLMTFISENFKSALATIHIPISDVPKKISEDLLIKKIETLINSAQKDFSIIQPKIAVLGLNPHAGENGTIGKEELEIIIPAIHNIKRKDEFVYGPFVPDAFFANKLYERFDFVLGMYHDQVLIPFKMLNFNNGVNFTAGLSFVRTSPDHGTAFDIAGKGIANEQSMLNSIILANEILNNRNEAS